MKHLVVAAHPRARSFTLRMAEAYCDGVRAAGGEAHLRDLYRIGFDPVLHEQEVPDHEGFAPRPDVLAERELAKDCDVFALFYPLWFNAPPAMLKGYIDRVFALGFGFGPARGRGNEPWLQGRRLVSFTSSGAPQHWVIETGAMAAMQSQFDAHLAAVCGLKDLGRRNIGGVHPGVREDFVAACAARVAEDAARIERGDAAAP